MMMDPPLSSTSLKSATASEDLPGGEKKTEGKVFLPIYTSANWNAQN